MCYQGPQLECGRSDRPVLQGIIREDKGRAYFYDYTDDALDTYITLCINIDT